MIVRIDEKGRITGIKYMGEDCDIAPFTPVGKTTFVVDACTRKIFTVNPGVATENKEADVSYMLGHDHEGNEVVIAFDPQAGSYRTRRGVIVASDAWVMTRGLNHLMRRYSTEKGAARETEKFFSTQPFETNAWKGLIVAGPKPTDDVCLKLLKKAGLNQADDGLRVKTVLGMGGTKIVVAKSMQPFNESGSLLEQSTLLDLVIGKDRTVTLTVTHGNEQIAFIVQRTFSYEGAKRYLNL